MRTEIELYEEMLKLQEKHFKPFHPEKSESFFDFYNQIQTVFSVGDYYYFIVNKITFSFEYINDNVLKVLGFDKNIIDMRFAFSLIHKADASMFLNFMKEIENFYDKLAIDKIMKYKIRYDYRVRKANGDYIRILNQVVPIEVDENGKIIKELMIQTDISELKKNNIPSLSFIGLEGEPSYFDVKPKTLYKPSKVILTHREKEILILFSEGFKRNRIADKLFISKFTLDNHRKNMLEKTSCISISELISKAINEGWI
ncbi:LuxR C-terminal-related transcriptional regulator [Flavobacterium sp. SUN046]|uniref:LuxR C-terminal-related transcriptional regulator n=1 Tax=Flavobacterium sp. SUN046 TaxID=3002440 RepID=UPI002DBC9AE1|nr:LuxR C-terminal-related transcriptional regulator [Flavobacterium sp. SUN046]MEC4050476.1 LuxR C-terminal-related transcriptional regulator [Flavobacterium sp. SUN046]